MNILTRIVHALFAPPVPPRPWPTQAHAYWAWVQHALNYVRQFEPHQHLVWPVIDLAGHKKPVTWWVLQETGHKDARTQEAIEAYQRARGLKLDGKTGPEFEAAMEKDLARLLKQH